jgi:hypothetical protein
MVTGHSETPTQANLYAQVNCNRLASIVTSRPHLCQPKSCSLSLSPNRRLTSCRQSESKPKCRFVTMFQINHRKPDSAPQITLWLLVLCLLSVTSCGGTVIGFDPAWTGKSIDLNSHQFDVKVNQHSLSIDSSSHSNSFDADRENAETLNQSTELDSNDRLSSHLNSLSSVNLLKHDSIGHGTSTWPSDLQVVRLSPSESYAECQTNADCRPNEECKNLPDEFGDNYTPRCDCSDRFRRPDGGCSPASSSSSMPTTSGKFA